MLNVLIQSAIPSRGHGITSVLGHLGAFGLFFVAIIDSSPLPTFGGPDILTAILAARQTNAWWEFAAVATAGSAIGAYLTFRLARGAGSAYLHSKFGIGRWIPCSISSKNGAPARLSRQPRYRFPSYKLVVCCGRGFKIQRHEISDGRNDLPRRTLHTCRIIADHYGRHIVPCLWRHPVQYWAGCCCSRRSSSASSWRGSC